MGDDKPPGVMWRTGFTVAVGVGWLIWLLVWWAFWSGDFTIAQKFAVAIMSLMVMGGLAGAVWIPFSMRHGEDRDQWKAPGFVWRIGVSMAVFIGLAVLVIYMLFFPWKDFNWCQSIVVIIVVLIVGALMMAPMWMRWGKKGKVHVELELDDVAEEISEAIEEAIEEAYKEQKRDDDEDRDDDDEKEEEEEDD